MNSNLQNANDAVFYYTVRLSVYIFHKNLYLHENLQTLTIFIRKKSQMILPISEEISNLTKGVKQLEMIKKKQQLTGGEMEYENS